MRFHHSTAALAVASALLLGACAHAPADNRQAARDQFQGVNRAVYGFNKGVDKLLIKPATVVYRHAVPTSARVGITNAFNNVDEPFTFINALLQGKPRQAIRTLARFTINTVLGFGGLVDHATRMGLSSEYEDFGQTLAVWGVKSGPYIVLPLLGPSTLRDTVGRGVEFLGGDPYRHLPNAAGLTQTQRYAVTGVELLDTRSQFIDTADKLIEASADEYAAVRSAYLQQRLYLIHDGAPPDDPETADTPAVADTAPPAETPTEPVAAAIDPVATPAPPALDAQPQPPEAEAPPQ